LAEPTLATNITIATAPVIRIDLFISNSCFVTIQQMQSFDTDPEDKAESPDAKRMFSVCPVDALPQGTCRRFFLPNGDELAIYNINGEYYAIDNFCPHRGAALSDGEIRG